MGNVRRAFKTALLLVAVVQIAACAGDDPGLARVGDTRLEVPPFQVYVEETSGEAWQAVSSRVASGLLDQYLDRQVVLEAAKRREVLTKTGTTSLGPSEMRWLMDELCGTSPHPAAEEIEREVELRLVESLPAQAHVRQILVDSLDDAEIACQRLATGEDFVMVSRELSRAPNAVDGGELGLIYQGSLPEEIDQVVFSLVPGSISDPVQGPSGYHIFQVLEMIPPGSPERAEVELKVRTELAEQGAREHTRNCVQRLADEIGVEVRSDRLWFPYDGKYAEDRVNA